MGGTNYEESRKRIGELLCLHPSPLLVSVSAPKGRCVSLIKPDDLATLHIHRLIFHDVPKRVRGLEAAPVLSEIEATLDEDRIAHLKRRLVRVLGSKSAYDIHFRPDTQSPVPPLIRDYTKGKQHPDDFVPLSQKFAQFLFEQQGGASSSGVLSIMDTTVSGKRGLTVLKLEREEGAQLELSSKKGKRTFEMSVLDNLVLTEGTRLFKAALFVRTGPGDDDFTCGRCTSRLRSRSVCDSVRCLTRSKQYCRTFSTK